MQRFTRSIEIALKAGDWYGALSTALTLPDICGRIDAPTAGSQARYVAWFDKYMLPLYTVSNGPGRKPHVFLSGDDCYALRCSYLHEGGGSIIEQRARKALDSFHFITPRPKSVIHCNQSGPVLQLQVDIFCQEVCDGVHKWADHAMKDNQLADRMKNLLVIHDSSKGIAF